jgi:hypothetical protein
MLLAPTGKAGLADLGKLFEKEGVVGRANRASVSKK